MCRPVSGRQSAPGVLCKFRRVFSAVKAHFQQVERRAGVGGVRVRALSVIGDRPGIGVNDLARAMDVSQPTASKVVKLLVEQTLTAARKHGPDRRAAQFHLLPTGKRVLGRAPGPFHGVLPEVLAGLDGATLERLEHNLGELIAAPDADERAVVIPLSPF